MKISVPNTDNEKLEDGTYVIVIVVETLRIGKPFLNYFDLLF